MIALLASQAGAVVAAGGGRSLLDPLVTATVDLGVLVIAVGMFLCVYRLLVGPHLADRALAVDTLGIQLIGLIILLSIRFRTLMFLDGILVLSLLGFAGTVAMAQFIMRMRTRTRASYRADPPEESAPQAAEPGAHP